ncbi:MAG: SulP family inorganic anion transporter [Magnetococcales bacterium]|nr:SulP family inorganic anion transporter [Magnetococcales bacterium]
MSTSSSAIAPIPWDRLVPPLRWWNRVSPESLKADLLAGLTGAIVVLPQGVAFAAIAGMPPVYGLYAGMIPAIVAAFFGSSWHLVSGPTTAASIVLFSLLSGHAEPGSTAYVQLALTMTFLVGLTQLGLGLLRMGVLVNFISHSVVIGFTTGAALLIAANQLHHFLGIHIPRGADFTHTLLFAWQGWRQIDPLVLAVSMTTLLTGIACRRWLPRVPYMIVALLAGTFLALALDPAMKSGITRVGAIAATLPPLSMPDFSLETLRTLAPGVIAVTLLALTEAISIARAMALRSGQTIDADQEFLAQGLSNLIGSFFSAYVATGSFNRSGLNYSAGARTPIAAASSGLMLMGLVILIAPLVAWLPHAAMAGVLFLVAWGLIDFHHIHQTLRTSHSETIIMSATFLATLLLNLEIAILFGVLLSLGIYLARTSNPMVLNRVPDPMHPRRRFTTSLAGDSCAKVRVIRVDGSLFFAAIQSIQAQFEALAPHDTQLIVVASGINFIDLAGAEFLASEAVKRRQAGGGLFLVRLKERPTRLLDAGGYLETIGRENLFSSKNEAIRVAFARLTPGSCSWCSRHVFQECDALHNDSVLSFPSPMAA